MPPALRWILAAASFGFVVVQLDVTIVNVALPRIGADLGTGVALSGGILIAARALQSLGAALLVPSSLALINHATAHDRPLRARAIAVWTAASGVGIASGPVIGAFLLHLFGWRSIFYVNLPLYALGAWLTLRAVPEKEHGESGHPLDPVGQVLAIVVLTGLVGSVIEFRPLGAGHPLVIGGLAAALVGGAVFVFAESRARAPILPLDFFRLPNFTVATGFGILVNLTYYGVIFVISLYLQQVRGYTPMQAGLAYLPLTATFVFSNLASGWMVARVGSRVPMVTGAASAVLNTARQSGGAVGVALFGVAAALGGLIRVTLPVADNFVKNGSPR